MKVYIVKLLSRNDHEAVFEGTPKGYQEAVKFAQLLAKDTVDSVVVHEQEVEQNDHIL